MREQLKWQIKSGGGGIVMILLIMIIFLCGCSIQAMGTEKNRLSKGEQYDQIMEKEYRNALREFLNRSGYRNSGINMTKIVVSDDGVPEGGKRPPIYEYTVAIYNKKMNQLDDKEMDILMTELVNIEVSMNNCTVSHKFVKSEE